MLFPAAAFKCPVKDLVVGGRGGKGAEEPNSTIQLTAGWLQWVDCKQLGPCPFCGWSPRRTRRGGPYTAAVTIDLGICVPWAAVRSATGCCKAVGLLRDVPASPASACLPTFSADPHWNLVADFVAVAAVGHARAPPASSPLDSVDIAWTGLAAPATALTCNSGHVYVRGVDGVVGEVCVGGDEIVAGAGTETQALLARPRVPSHGIVVAGNGTGMRMDTDMDTFGPHVINRTEHSLTLSAACLAPSCAAALRIQCTVCNTAVVGPSGLSGPSARTSFLFFVPGETPLRFFCSTCGTTVSLDGMDHDSTTWTLRGLCPGLWFAPQILE